MFVDAQHDTQDEAMIWGGVENYRVSSLVSHTPHQAPVIYYYTACRICIAKKHVTADEVCVYTARGCLVYIRAPDAVEAVPSPPKDKGAKRLVRACDVSVHRQQVETSTPASD